MTSPLPPSKRRPLRAESEDALRAAAMITAEDIAIATEDWRVRTLPSHATRLDAQPTD